VSNTCANIRSDVKDEKKDIEEKECYELSERISEDKGAIISQFKDHIIEAKLELKNLRRENSTEGPKRKGDPEKKIEKQIEIGGI
jgi:hypothetical protein